jgi:hypothetical protein
MNRYRWYERPSDRKAGCHDQPSAALSGWSILKDPPDFVRVPDYQRKLIEGTFALQAHDPGSVVRYKNIRVKRLD